MHVINSAIEKLVRMSCPVDSIYLLRNRKSIRWKMLNIIHGIIRAIALSELMLLMPSSTNGVKKSGTRARNRLDVLMELAR